jgi:NAD(P)-dependent dehydrogenase (short-subunit alcohol dehydrogenase family)
MLRSSSPGEAASSRRSGFGGAKAGNADLSLSIPPPNDEGPPHEENNLQVHIAALAQAGEPPRYRLLDDLLAAARREPFGGTYATTLSNQPMALVGRPATSRCHHCELAFPAGITSKHAIEGYSESLDHEVRTSGIRVVLVEPAYTRTGFDSNALVADEQNEHYGAARANDEAMLRSVMTTGDPPDVVAEAVVTAATAAAPRLRYTAGLPGQAGQPAEALRPRLGIRQEPAQAVADAGVSLMGTPHE